MSQLRHKFHIAAACALLATAIAAGTATAAANSSRPHSKPVSLAGTWKGTYSGAFSGTFTIHWMLKKSSMRGTSLLNGTITLSSPSGMYKINGSVHGKAIQFGAVSVGASYTGKVSGRSMSGNYMSPKGGGTWSAHKTS